MNPVDLSGIRKVFGPVVALEEAHLSARPGEVHAVLGENGAGKTTLLRILGGELRADAGEVRIGGSPRRLDSPRAAWQAGVGMVHQHFSLVERLTVLENLLLGESAPALSRLDPDAMRRRAVEVASRSGFDIELDRPVETLSVGAKQRVEILKVLLRDPSILVLDEPTAVLAPSEVTPLLTLVRQQAAEGRTVLIVAHKLDEVLAVADRVTVLRRGRTVLEASREEVDAAALSTAMVGREFEVEIGRVRPRTDASGEEVVARLRGAGLDSEVGRSVESVDLEVRRGEIVGVAGVEGNGQRALARLLAGIDRPTRGAAELPERIGFIPQDRRAEGLVGDFTLVENLALAWSRDPRFRRGPFVRWSALREEAARAIGRFDVRASGPSAPARTLSGGNQQRVVLAREFALAGDLLVAENPTRGLDVAGADFVRRSIVDQVAAEGGEPAPGAVLISTDLDEILAVADRVMVLLRGRLLPVPADEMDREGIGRRMLATATAVG